ncbi:biotin synthase-like protein [Hirsutella rhossiliensis]|uniref:Biotin synthase-like protein n=1 Tax=Hirsutella rhossiliensis TaxID=111463 RepID=A0A9P8MSD5_9HYPO|nr:biotin synthase-like protein [Hirsutella rhossiliensis]KAH0961088.1 biotin synthase-like protein [Hirsutella rhossiliensis]
MAATKIRVPVQHWRSLRRLVASRLRFVVLGALVWSLLYLCFGAQPARLDGLVPVSTRSRLFGPGPGPVSAGPPPLPPRIPCYGPRGRLLSKSPDDALQIVNLTVAYPTPFIGSQRELGLEQTWMTADGRYGPYGFGENRDGYNRSRVDWDGVDWGQLQDDCLARNAKRFPRSKPSSQVKYEPRTALVIRGYSKFKFKAEDLWNLRSIITETALKSGGEYAVFFLLHVQDRRKNIFASRRNYYAALREANIPPEFQSMVVLWDDHLLESWYDLVKEHRTMWQVNQPLQLFALHFPEFDHYWQIELDQRFMGDAGAHLDAVAAFALNEPRKQALERSSYAFNEDVHGTYADLMLDVDMANQGKSRAWGPMRIPDVVPVGPMPPVKNPEEDDFTWGVGEEADIIVSSFCADVHHVDWIFRGYTEGLLAGGETPRWYCPPAIERVSRTMLMLTHQAQHDDGLSVPSEAVFPTWAMWHGLKLSYPPQPAYMRPRDPGVGDGEETSRNPDNWRHPERTPWFGQTPDRSRDGMSHANPQSLADSGLTWWWTSEWPREIMDVWLEGDTSADAMPGVLAMEDGEVYVPNFAMHPVKS